MKKVSYVFLVLLLLLIFVGIFGFINQDKLVDRFVSRQSAAALYRTELLEKDNKIRLVTVGTGSPLPGERVMSCNAVFINGKFFVFDVGSGAAREIEQLRLPMNQLEAIFVTHWHADHYMDLPELINRSWVRGRNKELHLYGPEPLSSIMNGVETFLKSDNDFRIQHHGVEVLDSNYALPIANEIDLSEEDSKLVYKKDGVQIEAFLVDHSPAHPAFGYRIVYQDKSLVISGDTKKSEVVQKFAQGADILIHEALAFDLLERAVRLQEESGNSRNSTILKDIMDYHTSPKDAAEIAMSAGVKKLILTHLGPAPENPISRSFYRSGLDDIYDGPILLAEDGDLFIIE